MSTTTPDVREVVRSGLLRYRRTNNAYDALKPWLDFPLAMIILVASSPIILLSVLLVKLSSHGPLLYTQKRLGLRGKLFTIYKIRTMYVDSERDGVARWCVAGDPRVMPLGRFLRWCHLDELPQLVNVLMGEMSLVGPRPERPEFFPQLERALPNYHQRLTVRPGITGLAQVQQPPDENLFTVRRKLNYDLCYVERMNLWLDVRLILATAFKCAGVPFGCIGRILRLPAPDDEQGAEALAAEGLLSSNPMISETYVGLN
jgi:lipopolysaccharide/colanic/teichoic acid biosynthesis glycosyltransferase